MGSVDRELIRLVRRIRDRLHTKAILNAMLAGTVTALCIGIIVVIAARFVPVYNIYLHVIKLVGAALLGAFLTASFRTPGDAHAALKVDSLGLEERTVTALELLGNQSAFAMLEKNDALEHLKSMDIKQRIPIAPERKYLLVCLILTAVIALSGFVPNPMAGRAEERHKLKAQIAEQKKTADKLIEKVNSNPKLSEEQKKELVKRLGELKKELSAAGDEKEISKALGRTEKKLEYIKDKYTPEEDLKKIADAFSKNEKTKALADMINKSDAQAFKANIKKAAEELKKLSAEEKQQLAEELKQLAQELKSNPELSKAFAELSKKLASGELGDLSGELNELDQSISELMEDAEVKAAISELARELAHGQQNKQGQDDNGHQGQGNQPGSGGQQGQGNQPGANGQGGGQGGGAGTGTNMGNENQAPIPPGSTGINKKNGSEKKDGEYEKVFTPQTLGGEGETSNLNGTKGTGGTTEQVKTDKSQTVRGSSVPYNQVVGEYGEKAMESVNTSDIPAGMKDMVKEYFTSLEE